MLLLPLSDIKHLFDFKRLLGHLVQGCVIVLTRHLLHIDTIITLLWQSGLSWLWFLWYFCTLKPIFLFFISGYCLYFGDLWQYSCRIYPLKARNAKCLQFTSGDFGLLRFNLCKCNTMPPFGLDGINLDTAHSGPEN